MHPPHNEPIQEEIELLVTGEELSSLDDPNVPEEVKTEIMERLDRFKALDREHAQAEDERDEP